MSIPMTKSCYNIDRGRDVPYFELEDTNGSQDGSVINLFSRHNTLEEYMQLLNSSKK
ncbi:MAG TPA: hypothetical protein VH796_18190 [Nitrososphaeraceae archaeon]|jgi:hypothetical protein